MPKSTTNTKNALTYSKDINISEKWTKYLHTPVFGVNTSNGDDYYSYHIGTLFGQTKPVKNIAAAYEILTERKRLHFLFFSPTKRCLSQNAPRKQRDVDWWVCSNSSNWKHTNYFFFYFQYDFAHTLPHISIIHINSRRAK